jgi:hypothetical protein
MKISIQKYSNFRLGMDFKIRYCCQTAEIGQAIIANIRTTRLAAKTTTIAMVTVVPLPIDNQQCGRQEIAPLLQDSRIFGGSHATPHSWPWIVSYEETKPCPGKIGWTCTSTCGGTIIDSLHILTAAHCIGSKDPAEITITAGLNNKLIAEKTRQVKQVERIFIHSGYDSTNSENDIAILRLSSPIQTNRYVQISCLPGPDPQPGTTVILSGWGS